MRNEKKIVGYEMLVLIAYAIIMTVKNIQNMVGTYVTTMYAFTYNHGFVARGVMGTILYGIDKVFPGNQYTYEGVRMMCYASHFLFVALLLFLMYICLSKCDKSLNHGLFLMFFVFGTFAFPEYIAFQNFGRTDAACAVLIILMVLIIWRDKFSWLCVPLCGLGVMIHQGFILQFISVVLVLLFYKMMNCFADDTGSRLDLRNKKGWYYFLVAGLCVIVSALLFLYFNYNHSQGEAIYGEILSTAQGLAAPEYNGEVHKQLIMHEILGRDPANDERALHILNFKESIIYLILVSPYLYFAITFFRGLVKGAREKWNKFKYIIIAVGAWLILPDFLIKIDFGRWIFSVIFYYFMVVIFLLLVGDKHVKEQFHVVASKVKKYPVIAVLLALYPIALTPMGDVWITRLSEGLTEIVFCIKMR